MDQRDLLAYSINVLEGIAIPYMLVGSIASGAYGEPRLTQDIDIVIAPGLDQVRALCAAFPSEDFYVNVEAAVQASTSPGGQFKVLHPESGNKIDFMIARNDQWGKEQVSRRRRIQVLPAHEAFTARPEDIILSKMLYYQEGGSEKHLRDIGGILKISNEMVDRDYVAKWADKLGIADIWEAILARVKP